MYYGSRIPSALLLLCVLPIALADTLARTATVSDINGAWNLVEDRTPETTCPLNITHTTWALVDGVTKLAHNTIIVDGERCDSLPLSEGGKALVFYDSASFDNDLKPKPNAVPLPEGLTEMLGSSGPNMAALSAHLGYGEEFLLGYEEKNRVCGGKVVFPDRSTVFISRPFNGPMFINSYSTRLELGSRWMFIVPRYLSGACLYRQPLPGSEKPVSETPVSETPVAEKPDAVMMEPVAMTPVPSTPAPSAEADAIDTLDEPTSSPEEDGATACFPSAATVLLETGGTVAMSALRVGDSVHVGRGRFSRVFAFSHADGSARTEFVRIRTDAARTLVASPGHYVYANDRATAAAAVRVGDRVPLAAGDTAVVTGVDRVQREGLYNPQTLHGDIAVDGVVASTYTKAVRPAVADALLAPVRAWFRATGGDALAGALRAGAPGVAGVMPKGAVVA